MSDRFKKYAQSAKDAVGAQYDSDEDLPEELREKIKRRERHLDHTEAEKLRQEGWEKAETYPKLKRLVKGAWYGDKRKPRE